MIGPPIKATVILLGIVVLAWVGYGAWNAVTAPEVARLNILGSPARIGAGQIGGPFKLTDQNGKRRSGAEFRGQLMLIHFGCSACPDTGLATMGEALASLGESGNLVRPIFITLDPARDTVAVLRDYAAGFHPRLVALTGTAAEIAAVARAFAVGGPAAGDPAGAAAATFLMGVDGRFLERFDRTATPESMAEVLRRYL